MKCGREIIRVVILACLSVSPIAALHAETDSTTAQPDAGPLVRYENTTDRLTIHAHDASLVAVLKAISRQSGVGFLIDPAVEHPVSLEVSDRPLEQVLKTLTRGLNTVMVHDIRTLPGKGEQNVLVEVQLLPKGQTNTALLMPLLSPEAEAMLRADSRNQAAQSMSYERRLSRLEKLPPEQRERAEQIERDKAQQELDRAAAKAERKAERKQEKLARLNERLQKLQSRPPGDDPERRQQKINKLMQQIAETQAEPTRQ
jgi:type II secretory pathway component GspD/PulD (secretin)